MAAQGIPEPILLRNQDRLTDDDTGKAPLLIVIMNNLSYNESRDRNMLNGGVFYNAGKDFNGYLGDPIVDYSKIAEAYGIVAPVVP